MTGPPNDSCGVLNRPVRQFQLPRGTGRPRSPRPLEYLRGHPQVVLQRISRGDPLGVMKRVKDHLARKRLLMDEHRVFLCTLALVARYSRRYLGRPVWDRWLETHVAHAVASLSGGDWGGASGRRWVRLAQQFELPVDELDRACVRFHCLPFEVRDAFFALVLEGRSMEHLTYPGSRSVTEIARDARRALAIFLKLQPSISAEEHRS